MNIYDEWGGKKKVVAFRLSVPTSRSAKVFKKIIKKNFQCKKFYIGKEVAPKCYKTNYIDQDGELQEKLNKIYGRKKAPQNNCQEWDRPTWKSWLSQTHQVQRHDRRNSASSSYKDKIYSGFEFDKTKKHMFVKLKIKQLKQMLVILNNGL